MKSKTWLSERLYWLIKFLPYFMHLQGWLEDPSLEHKHCSSFISIEVKLMSEAQSTQWVEGNMPQRQSQWKKSQSQVFKVCSHISSLGEEKKKKVDSFGSYFILQKQYHPCMCKVDFARANWVMLTVIIELNLDYLNPYLNNEIGL